MRLFILHEQLTIVSRVTTQRTFFAKLIILENKSDKLIKSSHVKQRNGRIPSYHEYLWNGFRRDIAAIFLGLKPFCLILVYCEFFAIYRRCSDAFYIDDIFERIPISTRFSWCINLATSTSSKNVNLHSRNSNLGEVSIHVPFFFNFHFFYSNSHYTGVIDYI